MDFDLIILTILEEVLHYVIIPILLLKPFRIVIKLAQSV